MVFHQLWMEFLLLGVTDLIAERITPIFPPKKISPCFKDRQPNSGQARFTHEGIAPHSSPTRPPNSSRDSSPSYTRNEDAFSPATLRGGDAGRGSFPPPQVRAAGGVAVG